MPGLLPPLLTPPGHAQAVTVEGIGTDHLVATEPDVSVALLQALRDGEFDSDSAIFDLMRGFVEPFPVLRKTLQFWSAELAEGQVKEWAQDVILCMQVELWCDSASRVRLAPEEKEVGFVPDLFPATFACDRCAGLVLLVGGAHPSSLPGGALDEDVLLPMDFWDDVPNESVVGLWTFLHRPELSPASGILPLAPSDS